MVISDEKEKVVMDEKNTTILEEQENTAEALEKDSADNILEQTENNSKNKKSTKITKLNPPLFRLNKELNDRIICIGCGNYWRFSDFYPNYSLIGKFRTSRYTRSRNDKNKTVVTTIKPVSCLCKQCTRKLYEKIAEDNGGNKKEALFQICLLEGYYFDNDLIEELISSGKDAEFPNSYLDIVCNNYVGEDRNKYEGKTILNQINMDAFCHNFEEYKEEVMTFSEEDKKNKSAVIACFIDDPFKDQPIKDQPALYRNLNNMIDETMATDPVRQNAAIQVVKLFKQIDLCNVRIQELNNKMINPSENSEEKMSDEDITDAISSWTSTQKNAQAIIQNLCRDNGFTLKFKSGNSRASGTLSDMMREMDLRNYDKGKINFYDIKTSKSLGEVAEINIKNIQNQLSLTDQDYSEMVATQSETIQKLQRELDDTKEALRLIKYQEMKQELLEEYKIMLKDKGIDEVQILSLMDAEIDKRVKGDSKR